MGMPRLAFVDAAETRPDVVRAYRTLIWDGIFAQGMTSLTTGAFFTAYVVALGASNTLVGVLNAAAPLAQVLQWPSAPWVMRARSWRSLTALSAATGRSAWFAAALLPWIAPDRWRLPLLLAIISVHHVSNGVACCAFNSWLRALLPPAAAGKFFGHRTAWATAAGVFAGLVGGFAVQYAERAGFALAGYSVCIACGALSGWIGLWFLVRTPDAPRQRGELQEPIEPAGSAATPTDLFIFLGLWSFALNLIQPFVTVYLLSYLHLGVGWTMALTMAGQALNVVLYPLWGRLADHFTNRAVLRLTCMVSAASFLMWPAAAHLPGTAIQIFVAVIAMLGGGAAQAGAMLCTYLLTLKSAPLASPSAVIAKANGIAGLAAVAACAIGGYAADQFDAMQVIKAVGLFGLDVIFIAAAITGMTSAFWLARVHETGSGRGRDVLRALFQGVV